jgi:hypothetical protein
MRYSLSARSGNSQEQLQDLLDCRLLPFQGCWAMLRNRIECAIERGIAFIQEAQSPQGYFFTGISPHPTFELSKEGFTVYIPTFIIHALSCLGGRFPVAHLIRGALQSLNDHREKESCWRFFGRTRTDIPPDFDDTCCALVALKLHTGQASAPVFSLLERYQDRSGLFYTWIDDAANRRCFYRIDGLVNANILFYATLYGVQMPTIVRYLASYIRMQKLAHLSLYWISESPAAYMITRLYHDANVVGLRAAMPELIKYLLVQQSRNGSWGNELDTALATVSLLNAGYHGDRLLPAIDCLLQTQHEDGSWPAAPFCQDFTPAFYGSASLTTSFCLEALYKYLTVDERI